MHLIQILLPLYDNGGNPFPGKEFQRVRDELTERFGGITTYVRSPALGIWKEPPESTVHDEIVSYEVMSEELDRAWWRAYRQRLTDRFRQQSLIVRATAMELL